MPEGPEASPEPVTAKPTPRPTPRTPSRETKPLPDKKKGKKDRPEPTTILGKLWFNWVKPIGSVVLIVVLLRSTLVDWNDVPTGSMEPEIQVGDRILVNRLAYALQAPLSGPRIGIPFTGIDWKNPLDGIPQWQWGKPKRGDIVTFWNPVTGVRMVKRIVAEPGDTISMSGGVMTINGTTATYQDATASPKRQTKYPVPSAMGGQSYQTEALEDQRETLLGEKRTVQLMKSRWLIDAQLIQLPNGETHTVDEGYILRGDVREATFTEWLGRRGRPAYTVSAEVRQGVIYLDSKEASFNDLKSRLLEPYEGEKLPDLLRQAGLGIESSELQVNGKPVSFSVFFDKMIDVYSRSPENQRPALEPIVSTVVALRRLLMTSFGPVTLGPDEYYMVGDNRNNSHDSRYFGPVMRGEITGEAVAIAFSFKDNKILAIPPEPAWGRWFKDLD